MCVLLTRIVTPLGPTVDSWSIHIEEEKHRNHHLVSKYVYPGLNHCCACSWLITVMSHTFNSTTSCIFTAQYLTPLLSNNLTHT